jgi:hypothetical protein
MERFHNIKNFLIDERKIMFDKIAPYPYVSRQIKRGCVMSM